MLRGIDIFPAPVGVRIKEGIDYTTTCGGLMTILAILTMTLVSLGSVLAFLLEEDDYNETTLIENLTYKNDLVYEISDT